MVRLCLEANTDVFDWGGEDGVGYSGYRAGEVVLCVGEVRGTQGSAGRVEGFEVAAGDVKRAELD